MNLPKRLNKKGVSTHFILEVAFVIIGIVVLFELLAELVPVLQSSGDAVNATGAPLSGLFSGNGVVVLILMAAVLLAIIAVLFLIATRAGKKSGR